MDYLVTLGDPFRVAYSLCSLLIRSDYLVTLGDPFRVAHSLCSLVIRSDYLVTLGDPFRVPLNIIFQVAGLRKRAFYAAF